MSDEERCPVCEEGILAPRTGTNRFWKHLGNSYELPDSLPATQCDCCGAFSPTAAELDPLTEWLTVARDEPRPSRLAARHYGRSLRENHALTNFQFPWKPRRTIITRELGGTVGRRSVEHLIEGAQRPMLTTVDHQDVRRLGVQVDEGAGLVRWLFVPVSKYTWLALLDGLDTVGAVVAEFDGDIEIVDYNRYGQPVSLQHYSPDDLPGSLPLGVVPEGDRRSLRETVEDVPHRRAIMLDGKPVRGHSIGAFSFAFAYQAIVRVLEIAHIPKDAQPLLTAVPGSFGLCFEGPSVDGFDQAWETLEFLLDRASSPESLADAFRREPASEGMLAAFLEGMRRSGLELYLKTPDRRLHMSPARAKRAHRTLDEARQLLRQEDRLLEGFFMGFNASPNGGFAFRADRTEESISGRIDPAVRDEVIAGGTAIVISPNSRYRIRVQPMGMDARRDYVLRKVKPLSTVDDSASSVETDAPEKGHEEPTDA